MSGPLICTECRRIADRLKKGLCESCYARQRRGTLAPPPAKSTVPLKSELLTLDAIDELLARPGLIYTQHHNPFQNCVRSTALDPATGDTIQFLAVRTPGKES